MNLIDKIQKKHDEVLDFYSSEKLTERERNLLRTEMAFLLELKSDVEALNIDLVSSCYAVFDEEDNIVQLYQTEEKASKGMEEFKRSHEHTEFYVDTMQIN